MSFLTPITASYTRSIFLHSPFYSSKNVHRLSSAGKTPKTRWTTVCWLTARTKYFFTCSTPAHPPNEYLTSSSTWFHLVFRDRPRWHRYSRMKLPRQWMLLTCRSVEAWCHVSWEWRRQTSRVDRCRAHLTQRHVLAQHRVWHRSKPTPYHIQSISMIKLATIYIKALYPYTVHKSLSR